MLEFCKEKGLTSMIEVIKMDYINMAFKRLEKNDARNRFAVDVAGSKISSWTKILFILQKKIKKKTKGPQSITIATGYIHYELKQFFSREELDSFCVLERSWGCWGSDCMLISFREMGVFGMLVLGWVHLWVWERLQG